MVRWDEMRYQPSSTVLRQQWHICHQNKNSQSSAGGANSSADKKTKEGERRHQLNINTLKQDVQTNWSTTTNETISTWSTDGFRACTASWISTRSLKLQRTKKITAICVRVNDTNRCHRGKRGARWLPWLTLIKTERPLIEYIYVVHSLIYEIKFQSTSLNDQWKKGSGVKGSSERNRELGS